MATPAPADAATSSSSAATASSAAASASGGDLELLAHEAAAAEAASPAPHPAAAPAEEETPNDDEDACCLCTYGTYEGVLENGRAQEQGKLKARHSDDLFYEGAWLFGRPHGHGRGTFSWGGSYEGNFVRGFFSGHGVLILDPPAKDAAEPGWMRVLAFGPRFEGEWKNGTLVFKPGHCVSVCEGEVLQIYIGDVLNGVRHGHGEEFGPASDDDAYKGEWKNNQRHGKGELKSYLPERTYVGEFQRGKKHGRGEIKSKNGDLVEAGEYRNDRLHGQGVRACQLWKHRYEGEFVAGRPQGQGTCTTEDGQVFSGRWMDGLLHVSDTHLRWIDGESYEGALKDGRPHGYGIKKHRDGSIVYKGEWCEGKRHGLGEEPGYYCYIGQFKDDQRHGNGEEPGKYVGQYLHGERHGQGVETISEKETYTGSFQDGRRHGHGRLVQKFNDDEFIYEGEWRDGKAHGEGVLTGPNEFRVAGRWEDGELRLSESKVVRADGEVYDGEWKDGKRHGRGVKRRGNEILYDGEWKDGKYHGFGTALFNGRLFYRGELDNGHGHGQGMSFNLETGTLYEGHSQTGKCEGRGEANYADGSRYVGELHAGKREGQGEEILPTGRRYIGEWKEGSREGQGEETSASGEHYVGAWKAGERHGAGRCTYTSGYIYEGEWADGKPQGQSTSTAPDGSTTSGVWENGVLGEGLDVDVTKARTAHQLVTSANGDTYETQVDKQETRHHAEITIHLRHTLLRPASVYKLVAVEEPVGSDQGSAQGTFSRSDGLTYVEQLDAAQFEAKCQSFGDWKVIAQGQAALQAAVLDGHGTLTTADKHTYTGQFVKGKCRGQGELKTPAGVKHRGTWKADWLRVNPGQFISCDGARYSGEEKDGLPHGAGEVRHVDGSISRGGFEAGVQEGVGLHLQASGELFEGEFKAGKGVRGIAWPAPADTEGSSSSASERRCGRWYEGKLVLPGAVPRRLLLEASRLNGHERTAALLFPDETYYIGPMNRWDLAHGEGLLFGADGAELQSGTWVHGKFQAPAPAVAPAASAVAVAVDAASAMDAGPAPPGGSPAASPNVEGAVMPLEDSVALQREVARLQAVLAEKDRAHAEEIAALTRRLSANAAAAL